MSAIDSVKPTNRAPATSRVGRRAPSSTPPLRRGVNPTYLRIELLRLVRNPQAMFFNTILPAILYIVFGVSQSYADAPWGNSNAAMVTMISMAAYGALVATVGIGAMTADERRQGWTRQLALTPMSDRSYLATKTAAAVTLCLIPVSLIYLLGAWTGAEGPWHAWVLSAVAVLAGAAPFALYGLCFGLAFRSDVAAGAASGSLVVWAFAGNMFTPLSGTMLTLARFTPLFGYSELTRYPASEGQTVYADAAGITHLPLWQPIANLVAWTAVLVLLTGWLLRRSRAERQ